MRTVKNQLLPAIFYFETFTFISDVVSFQKEVNMKKVNLGDMKNLPAVIAGCMRMASLDARKAADFVAKAVENGLNFFDHADIYGRGESEKTFAKACSDVGIKREDIVLQSKCGIVPHKMYDFSKEHILSSVDGILERLCTDYLDVLLLHRPDALMEPEEVGEAFEKLKSEGKVRYFGVSNMKPMQMELLRSGLKEDLVADQIQFSPAHAGIIRSGFEFNMDTDGAADRDGSVLEYCRLKGITPQAWSPFQKGFIKGTYIGDPNFCNLNAALRDVGSNYGISASAAVVAWICRHPANIQTVAGTTNIDRLLDLKKGAEVKITREEWYKIYAAAGNILP